MFIPNSYLFATALAVFRKRCSHEQRTLCMQGAFSPRSSLRTDTKSFGCKPAGMLTGDVFINQVAFRTANQVLGRPSPYETSKLARMASHQ